jgi:hypothetical protein
MSINGFASTIPLYSINSTQAVLGNGSLASPSLRFSNASSTGLLLNNSNISIAVGGVQSALFSSSVQTFTGQVNTGILSANSVIVNGNSIATTVTGNYTPVMRDASGNPFGASGNDGNYSQTGNLVTFSFNIPYVSKSGTVGTDTLNINPPIAVGNSGIIRLSLFSGITYPTGASDLVGTVKGGNVQLRWLNLNQLVKVDNVASSGALHGVGTYWINT